MDIFEKTQNIETIKTVVKARWFYVFAVFLQGLLVKYIFRGPAPLPSGSTISLIVFGLFILNFLYWIYLRRPPEKISALGVQIIKASQALGDQLGITAILYFSGTVRKLIPFLYFITLIEAASLYKRRGVIWVTIAGNLFFSVLSMLEFFGKIVPAAAPDVSPASVIGNNIWLRGQIIGFATYSFAGAVMAGFLASLFRKREKKLQQQKDELVQKSEVLTTKTEELTKTKDYLHEALTKSDAARTETEKTKGQLEKANQELKAKIDELEKYGQLTTGREIKMVELKEKIKALEDRIGELEEK